VLTCVKKLNSPSTYFIHCDLIDKTKNLLNGKKSDVLAKFEMKGLPNEKVSYHPPQQEVLRDCITLSVKDEDGKLFGFKGLPMEFELEKLFIQCRWRMFCRLLLLKLCRSLSTPNCRLTFGCRKSMRFQLLLTTRSPTIEWLPKSINKRKRCLTRTLLAPVFSQQRF